jgi:peptidoglycan/xylan/chitin deacetylase (PgdA/CDA1 family)
MRPASVIAVYHAVGQAADTGYRDAVPLAVLERQLRWLRRHYAVLPLAELLERRRRGRSLAGLAALTFDDNHRSVLREALPLAASLDLPATWFLIAGPLGGAPFWRELVHRIAAAGRVEAFLAFARARAPATAALRAERFYRDSKDPRRISSDVMLPLLAGFCEGAGAPADFVTPGELGPAPAGAVLGSHTASHPVLAGLTAQRQEAEMQQGLRGVAALPWPATRILALPFGGPGSYDSVTLAVAARIGLPGLLLTAGRPAAADDFDEHPLATGAPLPLLVRDLPGRWPEERFA